MIRTFIAIPVRPSENLLGIIQELRHNLEGENIKWVEPENLHLTLKFIGDTDERKIPGTWGKLEMAGSLFSKMEGTLNSLDYFSVKGNPSVLFAKISSMPGLEELAKFAEDVVRTDGLIPEQRKFRPHLTLGRIKSLKDQKKFSDLVWRFRDTEIQDFEADRMVWYESILRPGGSLYLPLHTCFFSRV